MKRIKYTITVTALLITTSLLIPQRIISSQILPVGELEQEFIYDYLERVEAMTLDNFRYELAPYRIESTRTHLESFDYLSHIPIGDIRLFSFATANMRAQRLNRAHSLESLRAGIAGKPTEKIFLYGSATLDEARAKDGNYRGKKWRGLAGDVDYALAQFSSRNFDLSVGRFASVWGPRRSLLLAANSRLDGLAYSYHWGKLSISYRLASLNGLPPDQSTAAQFENRYFAGHRFDFHFSPKLRIGIFETIIFGGPGRQLEFGYLNPFIFFHGNQLNQGSNDNTFLGFDFTIKPSAGQKFYGQLLVDDIQIENSNQGDQEPAEIGLLFGSYLADIAFQLDARVEYTRVTNRTFNQILERNRYTHNGQPLGAARGNDYDEISLSLMRWFSPRFMARLNLSHYRQGEGNILDPWTEPWLQGSGNFSEPFPTGIVEKRTDFEFGFQGFAFDNLYIDIGTGLSRIRNFGHILNNNQSLPYLNLTISSNFSAPVSLK